MLASGPDNQAAFLRGKWAQPEVVLTALSCRSALLWNAAMRPTEAAINAACSILNRRTAAVRDETAN
jgi:hypothetical protein